MNFNFYMPVRIIAGSGCLKKNPFVFKDSGRCMIVTGKNSARSSGALCDLTDLLNVGGISYSVFDRIMENPTVSVCDAGAQAAVEYGADTITGIGGGSVLDASKAIAALAANSAIRGNAIFSEKLRPSLPLVVIPTTAGTGSEANNYAVLSLDGLHKKRTFKNDYSYPAFAFLDAGYTQSLNAEYTLSTALDAFCHCIESFMSPQSTVFSEAAAVYGAVGIRKTLKEICSDQTIMPSYSQRETLLYASCAAGAAINTTGTGFPHPLGYNLTMYRNIPHGRACAAFTGSFIEYTLKSPDGARRVSDFETRTGITKEEIKTFIPALASVKIRLSDSEIEMFIKTVGDAGNFKNNPYIINETEMLDIYRELFQDEKE